MSTRHSLVVRRYGKLVVKAYSGQSGDRQSLWRCECDCGQARVFKTETLERGRMVSCGCNVERTATRRAQAVPTAKRNPKPPMDLNHALRPWALLRGSRR